VSKSLLNQGRLKGSGVQIPEAGEQGGYRRYEGTESTPSALFCQNLPMAPSNGFEQPSKRCRLRRGSGEYRSRTHLQANVRPLFVYISDPRLLWKLRACLHRSGCVAEQRRAHELEVYLPGARNKMDARRKIDVCLALWQVKNPGVEAYVIPTAEAA
jgi:hypothetical protein